MEYLGFWVTRDGVKHINRKIEAIKIWIHLLPWMEVRKFIGVVNYYRDMWERRSHTLATSTKIMFNKVKFKWTRIRQDTFDEIKRILESDTLLTYPDFN